jgi:hypothetical protein
MGQKKRFTGANDNDYYCDAFRGGHQPLILSLRRHDIAHIASSVYLASSGAGFFFALFSAASAFNKSAALPLFHSIEIFEQRHEFFTLSYSAGRTRL